MILKTLISMLRCVWLGFELNSAGKWISRVRFEYPCCKRSLTFHCLCSFLTVSCRFCCSCSGSISVSSSQAFRKALRTLWSSCPKNSCRTFKRNVMKSFQLWHFSEYISFWRPNKVQTLLLAYLPSTRIDGWVWFLTVCFFRRSSGFPLSVMEMRAIFRTFSSSTRDSSNLFFRLLFASTCLFHSVVSFTMPLLR